MRTTCDRCESLIQLLLDGRISPADRMLLDRHIAECASCAAELDHYRAVAAASTAWARPTANDEPGDAFNASIFAAIAAEPRHEGVRADWRWAIAAAGLAIIALAVGIFLPQGILSGLGLSPSLLAPSLPTDLSDAGPALHATVTALAGAIDGLFGALGGVKVPTWAGIVCLVGVAVNLWFIRRTVTGGKAELI